VITTRVFRFRRSLALALGVAVAIIVLPACEPPPARHYEYVVSQTKPTALRIYDIDDGHRLLRTVPLPALEEKVAGMGASATSDHLYVSSRGTDGTGVLVAYDLRAQEIAWTRRYAPSLDGLCVTPDGRKIYVSSGEHTATNYFYVLDASDGDVLGQVTVARKTHNAVCNLDSSRAFLSSITTPYVTVVDTSDDHVVGRVGPFHDFVRPFTINGRSTLLLANVNHLIGFEVGSITTGEVLYRVETPGYPDDGTQNNPSHGVALTPDEQEAWIADSEHKVVHVFDVSGLPGRAPVKLDTIGVSESPYWVTFSLDGRYAYPSTGEVIDTATRQKVAHIERASSKLLEVDMVGDDVVRVASRHGIGYVTGPPPGGTAGAAGGVGGRVTD
jgi:DNA-binding beta-propeller fold protein YncE